MVYTVKAVSEITGVSMRTLHYYDEVGLLKPKHVNASGYWFYAEQDIELLQQILGRHQVRKRCYCERVSGYDGPEVFRGLGDLYVQDERFGQNY